MRTVIPLTDLPSIGIAEADYVVFGGTFDPIHAGHVSVIYRLLKSFPTLVLAPTAQNPWKSSSATSMALRSEMIRLVLAHEHIPFNTELRSLSGVILTDYDYSFSIDLVHFLRAQRPGTLYWAVGSDSEASVPQWRDWESAGVTTISVPVSIDVHSTAIRSHAEDVHPAIKDFVCREGLYGFSVDPGSKT